MPEVILHPGDNRASLRRLIDDGVRVHSVVTDPPYGLVSIQKRFGKEGAARAKFGTDGAFARASAGFMGKCFHPDTEILTSSGWVKVDEIEVGDTVATLNPHTRATEWQAVAQTHTYPFDGELVHVKHRSAEQMITANHKMLVSHDRGATLDLLTPGELKRSFHLFAQSTPQAGRIDDVHIRSIREFGKDRCEYRKSEQTFCASAFFRFFGLWLGDGYCVTRKNDHPANDFFGINVKKKRKVEAVRSALIDLGIRYTETPAADGYTAFYCYDFALLGWLKLLGGAKEKHIPGFLLDWDAVHLEHLYQGLMDSDGCQQGKNQEILQTCSQRLADDFQRLCFATGRSCTITLRPGGKKLAICGREVITSDSWVCCVLQAGKRMYGENSTTSSNVVYSAPYSGNVFCVGVPQHHVIYTRFNGKPVWSGNSWDGSGIERDPEFWALIYEILLPGGYVFAFSGSRTGHWQACAMEMAGFVMHPMHGWVNFQGMPKAHDAAKAIDKHLGVSGEVVPSGTPVKRMIPGADQHATGSWIKDNGREYQPGEYVPASDEAAQWNGWKYGTQTQKPVMEPIYLGQKPLEGNGPQNLLKYGVGAMNVDGCRVPAEAGGRPLREVADLRECVEYNGRSLSGRVDGSLRSSKAVGSTDKGRHPGNLLLEDTPEVISLFPDSKGQQADDRGTEKSRTGGEGTHCYGEYGRIATAKREESDTSSARFFHRFAVEPDAVICNAKATTSDRAGSRHPTVKPIALMQYLIRHITPPGGVVLDPFAGSGTTAEAARREGFDCILMEAESEYVEFLEERFGLGGLLIDDISTDPDILI